jgi:hypothetical protein
MEQDYQSPSHTSTLAIVSLVTGIICWFILPFLGAIVAVVTGHLAKREIKDSQGSLSGDGLATAGLVLGYIHLALSICGICVGIIFLILGMTPIICLPFMNEFGIWLSLLFGF